MRILYVEDSESYSRQIVQQFLTGHEVVHCTTLDETKRAYRPGCFDLILLDYDLPDGQGESVVEWARVAGDDVFIVANSNSVRKNNILIDTGANAVVTKGDEEERLLAVLSEVLPRQQSPGGPIKP